MTMAETKDSPKSASSKKAMIRKAAYRCFRDRGYHETTVDDVCRFANISKGSFYWHYPSKQEAFLDILDSWSQEVTDELHRQFDDAFSQTDSLTAIGYALQREAKRGRSIVPLWLEFTVYARRKPDIKAALARFYGRIRSAIVTMLKPSLANQLGEKDLEALAATIFGAYSGLMIQEICDPLKVDADVTVRRFLEVMRKGMSAAEEQAA